MASHLRHIPEGMLRDMCSLFGNVLQELAHGLCERMEKLSLTLLGLPSTLPLCAEWLVLINSMEPGHNDRAVLERRHKALCDRIELFETLELGLDVAKPKRGLAKGMEALLHAIETGELLLCIAMSPGFTAFLTFTSPQLTPNPINPPPPARARQTPPHTWPCQQKQTHAVGNNQTFLHAERDPRSWAYGDRSQNLSARSTARMCATLFRTGTPRSPWS